ncbi:MAG: BCSC C-terminal domain-containing protein [Deltaproteobacteria bacterium]
MPNRKFRAIETSLYLVLLAVLLVSLPTTERPAYGQASGDEEIRIQQSPMQGLKLRQSAQPESITQGPPPLIPKPSPLVTPEAPKKERNFLDLLLAKLSAEEAGRPSPGLAVLIDQNRKRIIALSDASLDIRLGWWALRAGRLDYARDWFLQAVSTHGASKEARIGLALTYMKQGDPASAWQSIEGIDTEKAREIKTAIAQELASKAEARRDYAEQASWLKKALELGSDSAGLHASLGWAYYHQGLWDLAAEDFRRALALDEGLEDARLGLALSLKNQGDLDSAWQSIEGIDTEKAREIKTVIAQELASKAEARRDYAEQALWLKKALELGSDSAGLHAALGWAYYHQGDFERAVDIFGSLYALEPREEYASGLYSGLKRLGDRKRLVQYEGLDHGPLARMIRTERARNLMALDLPQAASRVDSDIPELSGLDAPRLSLDGAIRDKSGDEGTSQLTCLYLPDISLTWPQGDQLWKLRLSRIWLDAGSADLSIPIGSAGIHQSAPDTDMDAGWAPELSWIRQGTISTYARLGLTPNDGPVAEAVSGGLGFRLVDPAYALDLGLHADPVRESILSFVGWEDPSSGKTWGRVIRYKLAAQGYRRLGDGPWSLGGDLNASILRGRHVEDNSHAGFSLGLSRDLRIPGMRYFGIGPRMGYEHYERNLSHFTWGHGGYFSPQDFTHVGLGLGFQTENGKRFIARGDLSLGWQWLHEASSPCFPKTRPEGPGGSLCQGRFEANDSNGPGTGGALKAAWLVDRHWTISGEVGWRSGEDYTEQAAMLGITWHFGARTALFGDADLPVTLTRMW